MTVPIGMSRICATTSAMREVADVDEDDDVAEVVRHLREEASIASCDRRWSTRSSSVIGPPAASSRSTR